MDSCHWGSTGRPRPRPRPHRAPQRTAGWKPMAPVTVTSSSKPSRLPPRGEGRRSPPCFARSPRPGLQAQPLVSDDRRSGLCIFNAPETRAAGPSGTSLTRPPGVWFSCISSWGGPQPDGALSLGDLALAWGRDPGGGTSEAGGPVAHCAFRRPSLHQPVAIRPVCGPSDRPVLVFWVCL